MLDSLWIFFREPTGFIEICSKTSEFYLLIMKLAPHSLVPAWTMALSVEFAWSQCVHVGFLWVIWFPSTVQKHSCFGWLEALKLPLGVCLNTAVDWRCELEIMELQSDHGHMDLMACSLTGKYIFYWFMLKKSLKHKTDNKKKMWQFGHFEQIYFTDPGAIGAP